MITALLPTGTLFEQFSKMPEAHADSDRRLNDVVIAAVSAQHQPALSKVNPVCHPRDDASSSTPLPRREVRAVVHDQSVAAGTAEGDERVKTLHNKQSWEVR